MEHWPMTAEPQERQPSPWEAGVEADKAELASQSGEPAALDRMGRVLTITAVAIGNALEWFDIVVYGFLAATMAKLFFPSNDPEMSLLITLGTFGLTFLMRPLGSLFLGAYADRVGRKRAMTLAIVLMLIGTFILAVAPTYAMVGRTASVIVLCARLLQGFSAGGEFGSSTAFLAELDPKKSGFYSSWQPASQGLMSLMGSGFGVLLSVGMSQTQVMAWGWRIPFVFGLLVGPVAIYIRSKLHENPAFAAMGVRQISQLKLFNHQKKRILIGVGLVILATVSSYTLLYIPVFATKRLGISGGGGFTSTLIFGALELCLCPLFGLLSDRIGRLPIMAVAAGLMFVGVIPLFAWLAAAPSLGLLVGVETALGILTAAYFGPTTSAMAQLFPASFRSTGLSLSYSLAAAIFGGFAPLIVASLTNATNSNLAPSFYIIFAAGLSLMAVLGARRAGVR
jgi:MHS family proline/betaine transporter-like MFS transporter